MGKKRIADYPAEKQEEIRRKNRERKASKRAEEKAAKEAKEAKDKARKEYNKLYKREERARKKALAEQLKQELEEEQRQRSTAKVAVKSTEQQREPEVRVRSKNVKPKLTVKETPKSAMMTCEQKQWEEELAKTSENEKRARVHERDGDEEETTLDTKKTKQGAAKEVTSQKIGGDPNQSVSDEDVDDHIAEVMLFLMEKEERSGQEKRLMKTLHNHQTKLTRRMVRRCLENGSSPEETLCKIMDIA